MTYPLLPSGSLAKPQIHGGRFTWCEVLTDPGPAEKRDRRITLMSRKGKISVRRDRVHTNFPGAEHLSEFDTVFSSKPPPGFEPIKDTNFEMPTPGKRANAAAERKGRKVTKS